MLVGVCCAMNQNRSMSIHKKLADAFIPIRSYGVSDTIRLPSNVPNEFNSYRYGITYEEIIKDLTAKNESFYCKMGIIQMLKRNAAIKEAPEYFFESQINDLDILISCDSRCFDKIFEKFAGSCKRSSDSNCVILGFEINDTLEDAQEEAEIICEIIQVIRKELEGKASIRQAVETGMIYYTDKRGLSIQCGFLYL